MRRFSSGVSRANMVNLVPRSPARASSRLSQTVCGSNTVGFWNLRPMPEGGDRRFVQLGQVGVGGEHDLAGVGPGLAGDDVHHRGLAGTVRTDHGAHLALVQDQRQGVQRSEAVEGDGDAIEIKQRVALRSSRHLVRGGDGGWFGFRLDSACGRGTGP